MARNHLTFLLIVLSSILALAIADDKYDSKYDQINVDEILATPRLRARYLSCVLGSAPCVTPDARYLKEKLPEAFVTKCRRCTEKQQVNFDKITSWYAENEPDTWRRIVETSIKNVQQKQS